MRVVILYRPNSEQERSINEFIKEFHNRTPKELELIDIDSREGISLVDLYDVVDNPVILIIENDGSILKTWQGSQLPLIDEVVAYANS